jgi:hypothetical protein
MEELGILSGNPEFAISSLLVLYGFSYELAKWSLDSPED